MRTSVYLIMDRYGVRRLAKRTPNLARQEIAVKVVIVVPDACFKAPTLNAEVTVRETDVLRPEAQVTIAGSP